MLGLLLALSWTASFSLIFKGVSFGNPIALMSWQALIGALVLAAVGVSLRGLTGFRERAEEAWRSIGLKPVLALFGFYVLQVIRRYTEGQSGANILFILGLAPLIVVLVVLFPSARAIVTERKAPSASSLVGAVAVAIGAIGAVAILGNWERPSSFSPFAMFPKEELLLLAAAACWAAFVLFIQRPARDLDSLAAAAVVLGATGFMLGVTSLVSEGPSGFVLTKESFRLAVMLGTVGAALGCYTWVALAKYGATPLETSSAVLSAPVLATLLIFVDQAQGLTGPNPMIEQPVGLGSLLAVMGIALVWTASSWDLPAGEDQASSPVPKPLAALMIVAAAVGIVVSAVGLFLPVRSSAIEGKLMDGTPFAAQWQTQGYEAAGAWLAVIAALMAAFVTWQLLQGRLDWSHLAVGAGVIAALLATAPALSDSLFVAWRSWIPPEIQHEIGTNYVKLAQTRIENPMFALVDAACATSVLLAIVKILWKPQKAS